MTSRRLTAGRSFATVAFLAVAVVLFVGLQLSWVYSASRLIRPVDSATLGVLATLDLRLESVGLALDHAWFVGDARTVLPPANALAVELRNLDEVLDPRLATPKLAEVRAGIELLVQVLDGERLGAASYSEAHTLIASLDEPAKAVAAAAREAALGQLSLVKFGIAAMAAISCLMAVLVLALAILRGRRLMRLLGWQQLRLRATRSVNRRVRYEAEHDALTGLANRRWLLRELARRIDRAKRNGQGFAVHLLDLDELKQINDSHGHHAGDIVLASIAGALNAGVRSGDCVGRLAGDEFVVIQCCGEMATAETLAKRLQDRVQVPVRIGDDNVLVPSASVGTALFGPDGQSIEALLSAADAALYRAKARPRPRARRPRLAAVASAG